MKNNYDVIVNFETKDGKPLSDYAIKGILKDVNALANSLEYYYEIKPWKIIIAQGVDSMRVSELGENNDRE